MQKNRQATKYQNHDQANPLHCIDLAVAIVNPQNLSNGRNHGNNRCGIDIAKFKGDKKENNRE
jgi:hypothetical protein